MLNAIPIFYLSYLKIPVHVWKKVRRIQREFLGGGRRGHKRISWINWDIVCLPKEKGGLGVRDVRCVNISLLTKWRWRLLSNDQAVWKDVVKSKYGNGAIGQPVLGEDVKPWFSSLWWRDICSIGVNLDQNWFRLGVFKKLGNGLQTSFWSAIWVGDLTLRDRFPRLFSISSQKDCSVADIRRGSNGSVGWDLRWRRRFFVWEQTLLHDMMELINPVTLSIVDDGWGWRPEGGDAFTVKSTYHLVSSLTVPEFLLAPCYASLFAAVWKCPAPPKVRGFVWQLFHGRIPTRENLLTRRVILDGDDSSCGLCGENLETVLHLFLYCEIAMLVWMEVFAWLQIPFVLPHNLSSLFYCLMGERKRKARRGLFMIGCSVVWNLWHCRNLVVFDGGGGSVSDVVDKIKVVSWKWWLSDSSNPLCLFYEWSSEPRICMHC
jgi:hypothetical protein